jgi:hypothetical protein
MATASFIVAGCHATNHYTIIEKGVFMSDQQDLETLLPKLKAIAARDVRYPDMPVEQAVKEAKIMATAAAEDAQTLTGVGLDAAKIPELDAAVNALSFAQAKLTTAMGELKDASLQWVDEEPKAYELRADILAAASYGLRAVPDAMRAVKRIRLGTGNPDMLQDLLELSELGKKYQKNLQAINFDVTLLDVAAQKASSLRNLYAKAFIEKSTVGAKDLRDRAFTYMRGIMGVVLDAAEYAFRKDKARLDYYYSAYRSRRSAGTAEPATPAPAPAA